jgi:predicted RNA-binding Zn ribbon-like protein
MKGMTKSKFFFVANHTCLDFINTLIVEKGQSIDLLKSFPDLIDWLTQAHVLNDKDAGESLRRWKDKPEGAYTLEQAKSFRTVLRGIVERIVCGKSHLKSTIDEINKILSNRIGYPYLTRVRGVFEIRFHKEFDEPIQLIVPIAESASDLLCHCDFSLIKRCENPACILYFYDISKNHTRRWCSMSVCGNRMKVGAHYRRHRSM